MKHKFLLYYFITIIKSEITKNFNDFNIMGSIIKKKGELGIIAGIKFNNKKNIYLIVGILYEFEKFNLSVIGSSNQNLSFSADIKTFEIIYITLGGTISKEKKFSLYLGIKRIFSILEDVNMEIASNIYIYNQIKMQKEENNKKNQSETINSYMTNESITEEKMSDYSFQSFISNTIDLCDNPELINQVLTTNTENFYIKKPEPAITFQTIPTEAQTIPTIPQVTQIKTPTKILENNQDIKPINVNKKILIPKEFQEICFENFFHKMYKDILIYMKITENKEDQKSENQKIEEQKKWIRELFSFCDKEISILAWKKYQNIIKDTTFQIESEKIIKEIFKDSLAPKLTKDKQKDLQSFLSKDIYRADYLKEYEIPCTVINRKINGIKPYISDLHIRYSNPNIFSFPNFESTKKYSIDEENFKPTKIASNDEYLTKKVDKENLLNEQKIKNLIETDKSYNKHLILKELILERKEHIVFVYNYLTHSVCVTQKKGEAALIYDSNHLTMEPICQNLHIQTGSNCTIFSAIISILIKMFGKEEDGIKICIQLNQLYHSNEEFVNKTLTIILNYICNNPNTAITEEEFQKAYNVCKECLKSDCHIKNQKDLLTYKHFGDFLRCLFEQNGILKFGSIKSDMEEIQKIIKNKENLLKLILKVLKNKQIHPFIKDKEFGFNLNNVIIKYIELLNIDINTTNKKKLINIYHNIYESKSRYKFLANEIIFSNPLEYEDQFIVIQVQEDNIIWIIKQIIEILNINTKLNINTNISKILIMKIQNHKTVSINLEKKIPNIKNDAIIIASKIIYYVYKKIINIEDTIEITLNLINNIFENENTEIVKKIISENNDITKNTLLNFKNINEKQTNASINKMSKLLLSLIKYNTKEHSQIIQIRKKNWLFNHLINTLINKNKINEIQNINKQELESLLEEKNDLNLLLNINQYCIKKKLNIPLLKSFNYSNDEDNKYQTLSIISLARYHQYYKNQTICLIPVKNYQNMNFLYVTLNNEKVIYTTYEQLTKDESQKLKLECNQLTGFECKNITIEEKEKNNNPKIYFEKINDQKYKINETKIEITKNEQVVLIALFIMIINSKTDNLKQACNLAVNLITINDIEKISNILDEEKNNITYMIVENQLNTKILATKTNKFCDVLKNMLIHKEII